MTIIESLPGEVWKQITPDIIPNIAPYYAISTYGRIYSYYVNRLMAIDGNRAYLQIRLQTINGYIHKDIHRLLMLAFRYIPGCENLYVNHINGNKRDNRLDNLEWVTQSENIQHAINTGLSPSGEDMTTAVHSNNQVHILCDCLSKGLSLRDSASISGMNPDNENDIKFISDVKRGKIWTQISSQYNIIKEQRSNQLFSDEQVHDICDMIENGLNDEQIINILGVDLSPDKYKTTLYNIRSGKRLKRISSQYCFELP